jgi:hypothetical protein
LRFHWYIWGNPPQLSCADGEQRFENSPAASPMVNFGLAKHCWNRFRIAFGGGEFVSRSRFAGPGRLKDRDSGDGQQNAGCNHQRCIERGVDDGTSS